MITETSAVAFRQNLGDMLNRVHYRSDSIVINKDGKPIAALVDARLFGRIRRMQDRFDELTSRLSAGFAGVPEEDPRRKGHGHQALGQARGRLGVIEVADVHQPARLLADRLHTVSWRWC